jgi:hypothetical protein
MYYIYFLKDLNNKIQYVGQTQNINVRKREHKRNKPPHIFELIEQTEISKEAKQFEIDYIKKYNTYKNGWNRSPGGEGFEKYDRKGIGGTNKGNIPWNKGIKNCFSDKTIEQMKTVRKGRVFSRKLFDDEIKEIRLLYEQKPILPDVGLIMKNGKKMSYIQAFCKKYSSKYNITPQGMKKIILKECWKNV